MSQQLHNTAPTGAGPQPKQFSDSAALSEGHAGIANRTNTIQSLIPVFSVFQWLILPSSARHLDKSLNRGYSIYNVAILVTTPLLIRLHCI